MKQALGQWLSQGKALYQAYGRDDIPGLAAEMAYHFIFALFPFVIFLSAIAGFVGQTLGEDRLFEQIMGNLYTALPPASAEALRGPLDDVLRHQRDGSLSLGAILGLVLTISAASSGVETVMKAFNRAFGVEETRNLVKKKLIAAVLTIVLSLLLVFGFASLTIGANVGSWIAAKVGLGPAFKLTWNVARVVLGLVGISLALAILYWQAPSGRQPFRWLTAGSTVATALLAVMTVGFSLYVQLVGASSYSKTYGTLFGLVLFLLYLHLTSQIILLGAELNAEATRPRQIRVSDRSTTDQASVQRGGQPAAVTATRVDGAAPGTATPGMAGTIPTTGEDRVTRESQASFPTSDAPSWTPERT